MIMRYSYSIILMLAAFLSASAQQRLASPQLTIKEPTFVRMSDAKVSWSVVEGADSYSVRLDGEEINVIGNTLYLAGKFGQHTVEVTAKSSSGIEQSLPATAIINVRDYGEGTLRRPYMIYDKNDWNLFAQAVTNNHFGNKGFEGEVVALAANIDFGGEKVTPVGKNYATGFRGVFDGKGRTLKNAVLEGKGGLGLFVSFHGIMKNLKVNNITLNSKVTKPSEGRCAIICGGEATGQFYNCMVTGCSVDISGEGSVGTLAGTIAAVLNSPEALVDRCIAMNNKVAVGNTHASALVARVTSGTVRNCIAQNNEVYTGVRFATGIAAMVCSPLAVIDHCLSSSNKITSKEFYASGVVGELSSGVVVNCTSDSNNITVEERRLIGGIAGQLKKDGNLINCLSKSCILNVKKAKEPYAGLVFANAENDFAGNISNCLVLSGEVNVSSASVGYVGVIGGWLMDSYRCADCFYSEDLITQYNKTLSGRYYGFGRPGSGGTNYDCAFPAKKSALESMSSDSILNRLNSSVYRLTSFGASEWVRGADGFPSIK